MTRISASRDIIYSAPPGEAAGEDADPATEGDEAPEAAAADD